MPAAGKSPLWVTGARVQADTTGGSKKHFLFGDILTEDVTAESVEHLRSLGYVSDKDPRQASKSDA